MLLTNFFFLVEYDSVKERIRKYEDTSVGSLKPKCKDKERTTTKKNRTLKNYGEI